MFQVLSPSALILSGNPTWNEMDPESSRVQSYLGLLSIVICSVMRERKATHKVFSELKSGTAARVQGPFPTIF